MMVTNASGRASKPALLFKCVRRAPCGVAVDEDVRVISIDDVRAALSNAPVDRR